MILPTRDGNDSLTDEYQKEGTSFDPTYKGWKLAIERIWSIFSYMALILPTRDGNYLKNADIILAFFSFDPTYKGWKRIVEAWLKRKIRALILPTRDGNVICRYLVARNDIVL